MIKTKFVGGINPFTGKPVSNAAEDQIIIGDGPGEHQVNGGTFFRLINDGVSIRCQADKTHIIAKSMRNFMHFRKLGGKVRAIAKCSDGMGKIWYVRSSEVQQATTHQQ